LPKLRLIPVGELQNDTGGHRLALLRGTCAKAIEAASQELAATIQPRSPMEAL
jgi:hypothetical protein